MGSFNFENLQVDYQNLLSTVILILSILIIRGILLKIVGRWTFRDADDRRKRVVGLKNVLTLTLLLGLVFIWGSELRAFALSIVAALAAFVIATKELILCIMGGMLKYSTKLFVIGDRIEIAGLRGKVTDHNFLITTLLEIGPGQKSNQFTGRVLKLPNSLYLTESVILESKDDEYNLMVFKIPLPMTHQIGRVEELLQEVARVVCQPYFEKAKNQLERIFRKEGVGIPQMEPKVFYEILDSKSLEFHVRMLVPFEKKSIVEKDLIENFFNEYDKIYREIEIASPAKALQ